MEMVFPLHRRDRSIIVTVIVNLSWPRLLHHSDDYGERHHYFDI